MALDKPAGLLTAQENDYPDRPSLLSMLHEGISQAKPWAASRAISYLMNPQRLDPEISGVLLLAKTKAVLTKLADLFGSEQPVLSLVTLVMGLPSENHFSVEARLAPHPARAGLTSVYSNEGKRARSNFEVMERFAGWTLLKCVPLTWRPHQLRAHLAHARLPIAGDEAYRGKPLLLSRLKPNYHLKPKHVERPLIGQPCLHAQQLELAHPVTGERLVVHAPLPKPLVVALKYLRQYAAL